MKRLLAVFLLCLSFSQLANAVTAWYQPTPYPLLKSDGTAMPQDLNIVHVWGGNLYYCSWCNNGAGITNFTRSDRLQTGGWGDRYDPFMKLDLTGLPVDSTFAALYFMPFPVSGTTTPFAFCSNDSTWDLSMVWGTQPARTCYGYYAAPTPGTWWGIDVTSWYNGWKNGTKFDGGISMFPQNTNNNFDDFRSSAYADYVNDSSADGKRPILRLDFTPTLDLKMPLPGGYAWLLTNEIGGYECMGQSPWPDTAHQDVGSYGNYYSIDISWKNNGSMYGQYNTPVLAAAGGKVIEVGGGNNNGDLNGFYIVIDHDSDGNIFTGFTTRYLHLKQAAAKANGTLLTVGNSLNQGDQIGIMGTTGKDANGVPTSTAEHLHFGVRYQNKGYSYTPELTKVVMDGLILKSYQTECSVNTNGIPTGWIRGYSSTLTPTGY